MKDQGKMKTLFFLAAAMSFTAFSQDWYQDISGAGFRQIRQNDTTGWNSPAGRNSRKIQIISSGPFIWTSR